MQNSKKLAKWFLSVSLQLLPQNDEIVALVQRYDLIFVVFPTTVTTKQQNRSVGLRVNKNIISFFKREVQRYDFVDLW